MGPPVCPYFTSRSSPTPASTLVARIHISPGSHTSLTGIGCLTLSNRHFDQDASSSDDQVDLPPLPRQQQSPNIILLLNPLRASAYVSYQSQNVSPNRPPKTIRLCSQKPTSLTPPIQRRERYNSLDCAIFGLKTQGRDSAICVIFMPHLSAYTGYGEGNSMS